MRFSKVIAKIKRCKRYRVQFFAPQCSCIIVCVHVSTCTNCRPTYVQPMFYIHTIYSPKKNGNNYTVITKHVNSKHKLNCAIITHILIHLSAHLCHQGRI